MRRAQLREELRKTFLGKRKNKSEALGWGRAQFGELKKSPGGWIIVRKRRGETIPKGPTSCRVI